MIEKMNIIKLRGFENTEINLGKNLTVIAGKNGTSKSTILGLLGQPFSFYGAKYFAKKDEGLPEEEKNNYLDILGKPFETNFSKLFKFSPTFDIAKEHKYTLSFAESFEKTKCYLNTKPRNVKNPKNHEGKNIRFNHFIDDNFGTYGVYKDFVYPTLYLGLSRIFPIGEAANINSSEVVLSEKEEKWLKKNYNNILYQTDEITTKKVSKDKMDTIGTSTDYYDFFSNSSGQDNIGKILISLLSFKRLEQKLKEEYKGGLLLIDEIDATLFAASQIKLFDLLLNESKKLKLQIVMTTHSLEILERTFKKNPSEVKLVYLDKRGKKVIIADNVDSFIKVKADITAKIDLSLTKKKIKIYTEDGMVIKFMKEILKTNKISISKIDFVNVDFSYQQLDYLNSNLEEFKNSIIIYDGDVRKKDALKKDNAMKICLEGALEKEILNYLNNKDNENSIWAKTGEGLTKELFMHKIFNELNINLEKNDSCKNAFKKGKEGEHYFKLFLKHWPKDNKGDIIKFVNVFKNIYENKTTSLNYSLKEILKK